MMTRTFTRVRFAAVTAAALLGAVSCVTAQPARAAEPMCVMLLSDEGGETLINRCPACREVTLARSRPGEGVPNIRAMMLPGTAATPAPFRGPGRTRIVGERDCPPPPGSDVSRIAFVR